MIHLITISEGEESRWGKLGRRFKEETEPASPQKTADESWPELPGNCAIVCRAWQGRKRLSNTARDATGHRRTAATQPQMSQCQIYQAPRTLLDVFWPKHLKVHQRRRGLIKTTSDSCRHRHLSVVFDFADEDAGLISGRNPPGISKCPCCVGVEQNVYNSFWGMAGFRGLCQPVHFLNKHHLFGGCSTSYTPIPVHLFFRPVSPCSSFANATVSALLAGLADGQDGEHGGHPLPSLRSSHPDDWYIQVHPTASALPSPLSPMWGSELNSGNMSSSVYLTLPVMAPAMS